MLLLSCTSLTRGFDAGPLFRDLGFELNSGDRVGLVGPNGVGKTTLLRLLAGLDRPDDGEVKLHAGARAALLQQQAQFIPGRSLFAEAKSALDELLLAHEDMVRTAEALAKTSDDAERKSLAARYDRLTELMHHHDAYNVDHRVEQVLDGLGLRAEDYERPVETFSGGQQSRLMLAKLLLAAPDVLLLDEPSNHLDIRATRWLEDYLSRQHEAMLIVSHDRYFLDKVVTKIFEMTPTKLTSFTGNYQAYVRQREERYQLDLKAWEAQREYIEKQEDYIRRVHYGQLAKQAQSRQKQLDKLERVDRPTKVDAPRMSFGEVSRTGDVVVSGRELSKSYDKPLFKNLSFSLLRGKRLGIMGANGSGKTTLLRVLLGQEKPDKGEVQQGHLVEFGYYDQHLKVLPEDQPVIRAVWPHADEQTTDQQRRNLLARFGLVGDIVNQQVGALSGGERSRAALARLVALGVNVLVLDEPTNHLDLWACESLEEALKDYEGTVICVSHDRYFLNRSVDQLLVLEGEGVVRVIHGNYDTYEMMRAQLVVDAPTKAAPEVVKDKPRPERDARKKKRKFPYRKVEDLEADIAAQETRLRGLEEAMASPDLYRDAAKVKQTTKDFEDSKAKLAQLYEHWEEAVELN